MENPHLTYAGPGDVKRPARGGAVVAMLKRIPKYFLLVVVLPTVLTFIYYFMIASPIYVSEARFVVRQSQQAQPSSIGMVLQNVGITNSQNDASAVHEYMKSRAAVADVQRTVDLPAVLARPGADALSRYPRPWERMSPDSLHRGFNRSVIVGFDSGSGMSTLRVKGFLPADAKQIADALLDGGEQLVNELNDRANEGAITEAQRNVDEAEMRLSTAQVVLTNFRNREGIIDPSRMAQESSELVGGMLAEIATMRAERAQLVREAPESPALPAIDGRIAAYQAQVDIERAKIAGAADSLAPKMTAYDGLVLDREYAGRALTSARAALDSARIESRSQTLYLERVVAPNLPSDASLPNRWRGLLTVFATLMLIYGVGWLIVAGVREHQLG